MPLTIINSSSRTWCANKSSTMKVNFIVTIYRKPPIATRCVIFTYYDIVGTCLCHISRRQCPRTNRKITRSEVQYSTRRITKIDTGSTCATKTNSSPYTSRRPSAVSDSTRIATGTTISGASATPLVELPVASEAAIEPAGALRLRDATIRLVIRPYIIEAFGFSGLQSSVVDTHFIHSTEKPGCVLFATNIDCV